MSAIVNQQTFIVSVKFKNITDPNGFVTGIKILPNNSDGEEVYEIECHAVCRDWKNISLIKEEALIMNHIKGTQFLRAYVLYRLIIFRFFRSWNLVDSETNQPLPITLENIDKMQYILVRTLVKRWLQMTGGLETFTE